MIIFRKSVLTILMVCQFLSLMSSYSSGTTVLPPLFEQQYEGYVFSYDRVNTSDPARYDTFFYTSFDHKPLKNEYDLNDDGTVDFVREWIRVKNVIIQKEDRNLDGKWDTIVFEYAKTDFKLIDTDLEGRFDRLDIFPHEMSPSWERPDPDPTVSYPLTFEVWKSDDIDLLVSCLENLHLENHKLYVLGETFKDGFSSMIAQDKLLVKLRLELDLPSNDILPISLNVIADAAETGTEPLAELSKDLTSIRVVRPKMSKPIENWMAQVCHEIIRTLIARRLFFEINTDPKVSWTDFLEYHQKRLNNESIGIVERITGAKVSSTFYESFVKVYQKDFLFRELEAHLYSIFHNKYYYLLSYRSIFSHSHLIYIRALSELISEGKLTPPSYVHYDFLTRDVQKLSHELKGLPKAEVDETKKKLKDLWTKNSF